MLEQYTDKNIDLFPENKIFRIIFDNVTCRFRIMSKDHLEIDKLINAFSVENKAAFFTKQYGFNTEAKLYTINKFGFFQIGMLFEVLKYIKDNYGTLNVVAISLNTKQFIDDYLTPLKNFAKRQNRDTFEISNISKKIQPRPYQTEIIKALIFDGFGRGLFECPTGSGKSFIIANFIWTLHEQYDDSLRYLIFVPNRQLVEQFYTDLLDYGYDPNLVTRFTAGLKKKDRFNPEAKIIVANRQYMFGHADSLPRIDVLIADEAHSTANPKSSTFEFVDRLNCRIKIGCSGTLPREKYQRLSLIGLFSRIIYSEDIVNLQNKGYLTKLDISLLSVTDHLVENNRNILFNLHSNVHYSEGGDIAFNESFNSEIEYITNNFYTLYEPVLKYVSDNLKGNILILFDRIEFGKNMYEAAKEDKLRGSDIYYVDGTVPVDDREKVRAIFEKSDNNILFAQSVTFSVGINIKNLNNIVFMFSGKSLVKVIQAIGRTLRLHSNKNVANLIDVCFNFKYSRKHLKERLKLYRDFYNKQRPDRIIRLDINN